MRRLVCNSSECWLLEIQQHQFSSAKSVLACVRSWSTKKKKDTQTTSRHKILREKHFKILTILMEPPGEAGGRSARLLIGRAIQKRLRQGRRTGSAQLRAPLTHLWLCLKTRVRIESAPCTFQQNRRTKSSHVRFLVILTLYHRRQVCLGLTAPPLTSSVMTYTPRTAWSCINLLSTLSILRILELNVE